MSSLVYVEPNAANEIVAMTLLLMSSFSLPASLVLLKLEASIVSVYNLILLQAIGQVILASFGCMVLKVNPIQHKVFGQLLAGLLGAVGTIVGLFGVIYMELVYATMLKFSAALFTPIFARIYFKEKISEAKAICIILGFIALSLTTFGAAESRFSQYPYRNWAIGATFACSISISLFKIIAKELSYETHFIGILLYTSIWYLLIAIALKLVFDVFALDFQGITLVVILTLGLFFGQVMGLLSLTKTATLTTTIIKNLDILFGVVFGLLIFKEQLQWEMIAGFIILLIVVIVLMLEEYRNMKKNEIKSKDSNATIQNSE